jgi:hypothetical protein
MVRFRLTNVVADSKFNNSGFEEGGTTRLRVMGLGATVAFEEMECLRMASGARRGIRRNEGRANIDALYRLAWLHNA